MKWVKDRLLRDKRFEQEKYDLPVVGYDAQDARRFQFLASYFSTGEYNYENTGRFDSYVAGRMALQFKKFLIVQVHNRFGGMKNFMEKVSFLKLTLVMTPTVDLLPNHFTKHSR